MRRALRARFLLSREIRWFTIERLNGELDMNEPCGPERDDAAALNIDGSHRCCRLLERAR
jgi:hypothetical protein